MQPRPVVFYPGSATASSQAVLNGFCYHCLGLLFFCVHLGFSLVITTHVLHYHWTGWSVRHSFMFPLHILALTNYTIIYLLSGLASYPPYQQVLGGKEAPHPLIINNDHLTTLRKIGKKSATITPSRISINVSTFSVFRYFPCHCNYSIHPSVALLSPFQYFQRKAMRSW